ncbi:MAG: tRNA-modifying protein YgfZ [Actinomycetota bacterium]|jgi:folate-binding protein YgfZ
MVDTIRVEGVDATSYLQGQVSQDVESLAVGGEAWSYVLAPNGHIDGFVLVRRTGDESFELDIDAGFGEQVETRLRRFLLRTKATITLAPTSAADPDDSSEVERIRTGRPAMGKDIDERSVPAELGWLDRAVSFTKGCYVGQELVARMDSRVAEPPRRLVRLAIDGDAAAGAEVVVDDVAVGAVTSAAPLDGGAIALGYVKRGTDLGGRATVGGANARIEGVAGA